MNNPEEEQHPNRYYTKVTLEFRNSDATSEYKMFSDIQIAYIWLEDYIQGSQEDWVALLSFQQVADDLDESYLTHGLYRGVPLSQSPTKQVAVYYGNLVW